jgi:hypothetical protein
MNQFPGNCTFAFTIFDDTDSSTVETVGPVYRLLTEIGVRTTKSVWPLPCSPEGRFFGSTLQDREYLDWIRNLKKDGFEIALHNVRNHDATRDDVCHGLDEFERLIGELPRCHANHAENRDNMYWGPTRLTSRTSRCMYDLATRWRYEGRFCGHVEQSPYFWGDLCRQHITYVRNFVFGEINLDGIGAAVPYHDPSKPFVKYWFSASEGRNVTHLCNLLCERNQDQLAAQGGVCIVYTHFADGFVEHGKLNAQFEYLMRKLARKNGWFVPTATLLDYLRARHPQNDMNGSQIARLEKRWLLHKLRNGFG